MTVTTASAMCIVAEPDDSAIIRSAQKATNTTNAEGLKRMRAQDTTALGNPEMAVCTKLDTAPAA
jgi:hypothetical protein